MMLTRGSLQTPPSPGPLSATWNAPSTALCAPSAPACIHQDRAGGGRWPLLSPHLPDLAPLPPQRLSQFSPELHFWGYPTPFRSWQLSAPRALCLHLLRRFVLPAPFSTPLPPFRRNSFKFSLAMVSWEPWYPGRSLSCTQGLRRWNQGATRLLRCEGTASTALSELHTGNAGER